MFEVEQKFALPDATEVEAILHAMGVAFENAVEQVDRYFAHPTRDFGQTDEALRIRQVGEANFVTYKGPKIDQDTKTRRELELRLGDGEKSAEQWAQMLELLSFTPVGVVRKRRRKATFVFAERNFEVALDNVDGVGQFLELEVLAEEADLDQARKKLSQLADKLRLAESERRSYLELLLGQRPD